METPPMPNKNIKACLKEVEKKEKMLSPSPSGVRLPGDCLALYACPACESRRYTVAAIYGSLCSRLFSRNRLES